MERRFLRFLALGVLAVGIAALAPAAMARQTRTSVNLEMLVNFDWSGNISVTLPSGTPVGVSGGGNPTVIPAGYYTFEFSQPGCVDVPTFILQGPGVNLQNNLVNGEDVTDADVAFLQPNSTYTWRSGAIVPPVYFTFQTNGDVIGTLPPPAPAVKPTLSKTKQVNTDIVGSESGSSVRGTVTAAISAAGAIKLAFKGANVTTLKAGRYKLTVDDTSKHDGLTLDGKSRSLPVTTASFVGKRTVFVALTAGTWFATTESGGKKKFVVK